jgi:hypothetical protein
MKLIKKISLCLLVSLIIQACSPPPPPTLSFEDRDKVDSLFNIEYDKIKDTLDVLCASIKLKTIQPAVDSILLVRLREIAKQKSRHQQ